MPPAVDWAVLASSLSFAFQPIVNCHTGACYGVEAFLRGAPEAGFDDVESLFDAASAAGCVVEIEEAVHSRAVEAFKTIPGWRGMKLFLNADIRVLESPGYVSERLLARNGISRESVVLEVSEGRRPGAQGAGLDVLRRLREENVKIALDDFGVGYSSLEQLYFTEPDLIKINRFFIAGVSQDQKKKLFLSHIVTIAHLLGITVIAEGVETDREFWVCKETGCDLVQGYLVQRPCDDPEEILPFYPEIAELARQERRQAMSWDQRIVRDEMSRMEPLPIDADMLTVFEVFRTHKAMTFYPIVDNWGEPLGIVRDRDLKEYAYSLYGIEKIVTSSMPLSLPQFIARCPIADVNAKADEILRIFSANPAAECILLVDHRRYVGFLSGRSLLRIMNERTLAAARDQNPLTNLPGNARIHDRLAEAVEAEGQASTLFWLDFDNFKPFNDKYGFRQGDRALVMFAEMLVKETAAHGAFVGHIGGDDFFALFQGADVEAASNLIRRIDDTFANDVESFYDEEDRLSGRIQALDRHGVHREFPLLSCSAAAVHLASDRAPATLDDLIQRTADIKKRAKAEGGFALEVFGPEGWSR